MRHKIPSEEVFEILLQSEHGSQRESLGCVFGNANCHGVADVNGDGPVPERTGEDLATPASR